MTGQPLSLDQILTILRRRSLLVLVFIACTVGGTAIGVSLWPETYEVTASLLVKIGREISPPTTVPGGQSMAFPGKRPEDIASEIEIIRSPYLLQKLVDRLEPEFFLRPPPPPTSLFGQGKAILGAGVRLAVAGGREILYGLGLDKRLSDRDRVVLALQKNLSIEQVRKTDVIEIRFRTGDPQMGAEVINTLIALYLDQHIAVFTTPRAREFFEKQMEILEANLKGVEEERRRFKERHGITAFDEQRNLLLRQARDLHTQSQTMDAEGAVLEAQRDDLRRRLAALPREGKLAGVTTHPAQPAEGAGMLSAGSNPISQALEQEVIQADARLQGVRARQREQKRQLAAVETDLKALDGLETELKRLDRTLGILEQDYALYAKKREEARISEAMDREKIANISVISPAIPPARPIQPKRLLLMVVALVLGPTGGVVMAFVAEYFDPSFGPREAGEASSARPAVAPAPSLKDLHQGRQESR
jgi:uncharacterized protein involved in exopolysaccharide biosynthesis